LACTIAVIANRRAEAKDFSNCPAVIALAKHKPNKIANALKN